MPYYRQQREFFKLCSLGGLMPVLCSASNTRPIVSRGSLVSLLLTLGFARAGGGVQSVRVKDEVHVNLSNGVQAYHYRGGGKLTNR